MASVVKNGAAYWQHNLKNDIFNTVLKGYKKFIRIVANPLEDEEIDLMNSTVAWCFCVLGKDPDYLSKIAPLDGKKVKKLFLEGVQFAAIQLVQTKLKALEIEMQRYKVGIGVEFVQLHENAEAPDLEGSVDSPSEEVQEEVVLNINGEIEGDNAPLPIDDEEGQLHLGNVEDLDPKPSLGEQIDLLKHWLKNPLALFLGFADDSNEGR